MVYVMWLMKIFIRIKYGFSACVFFETFMNFLISYNFMEAYEQKLIIHLFIQLKPIVLNFIKII